MKKKKIIISILIILSAIILLLVGFLLGKYTPRKIKGVIDPNITTGYELSAYSSKLTEEEHVARIKDIEERNNNGRTKTEVYIVYSFDNAPEYFLIQHYSVNENGETVPIYYSMGFIENDKYYLMDIYARDKGFLKKIEGENPYSLNSVLDKKKYYADKTYYGTASIFAWETDDGKMMGYDTRPEYDAEKKTYKANLFELTEEKIEELKKNRFVATAQTEEFNGDFKSGYYMPEFSTTYTPEEHELRIRAEVQKRNREIEYFSILYSFDGAPKYFILEYSSGYPRVEYGYIENDEYYRFIWSDNNMETSKSAVKFTEENPYRVASALNCKKYFSPYGQFAWEAGDGRFKGFEVVDNFNKNTYYVSNNVIDMSDVHKEFYSSKNFINYSDRILLWQK